MVTSLGPCPASASACEGRSSRQCRRGGYLSCVRLAAVLAPLLFWLTLPVSTLVQEPQARDPGAAFEVAAVRPNRSGGPALPVVTQPGGRLTVTNLPLREIIRAAYQTEDYRLVGGPDWIRTSRFDIQAKAETELPPFPPPPSFSGLAHPAMPMLRALLAERFGLEVHREVQSLPVFALVFARSDQSLGPQLSRSSTDCDAVISARRAAQAAGTLQAQAPGQVRPCGFIGSVEEGLLRLTADSQSLPQMLQLFSGHAGRHIVDQTALAGLYSFRLQFALSTSPAAGDGVAPPVVAEAPSFFTAVQEQLGLRLESTRQGVEVLVIDRVNEPTPN